MTSPPTGVCESYTPVATGSCDARGTFRPVRRRRVAGPALDPVWPTPRLRPSYGGGVRCLLVPRRTATTTANSEGPSPDCGHRYKAPSTGQKGGKYSGTATATWTVEWQAAALGDAGEFTEVRETPFTVDVREVQVLN